MNDRLELHQNNDESVSILVTDPEAPLVDGEQAPFDLTGCTVVFLTKPSQETADDDSAVKTYTATIDDVPATGKAVANVPKTDLTAAIVKWWRVDVTSGLVTRTANYGILEVIAV